MLIGVIGDDFTGSSDIANNLKKAGMSVTMYTGIPKNLNKKKNKSSCGNSSKNTHCTH